MVSAQTIGIVKLTLPLLTVHGEALTRHFYRRMFEGDPAVLAFFNPAHQHSGSQQRALAGAILAYAEHIENPAVLAPAIELITQKHVSLGIQPEHYPIVGKHLLGSIREVLGEAATDAVIDAWAEAYGFLADVLIARETELYRQQRESHGWCGFEPFIVEKKVTESDPITSFYLKPRSGLVLQPFKPGQFVTVRVADANGKTTMRNYSLSNAPGSEQYRISVKREISADKPAGQVSNYLHDQIDESSVIHVAPPCGEFTLDRHGDSHRPLVLLAAGVGVTPILSMLHEAVKNQDRDIWFIHAVMNGKSHAFRSEVRQLVKQHSRLRVHFCYQTPTADDRAHHRFDSEGRVDVSVLQRIGVKPESAFYFCGPTPFMASLHRGLSAWGVPASQLHYEFFGPAGSLSGPAAAARPMETSKTGPC